MWELRLIQLSRLKDISSVTHTHTFIHTVNTHKYYNFLHMWTSTAYNNLFQECLRLGYHTESFNIKIRILHKNLPVKIRQLDLFKPELSGRVINRVSISPGARKKKKEIYKNEEFLSLKKNKPKKKTKKPNTNMIKSFCTIF